MACSGVSPRSMPPCGNCQLMGADALAPEHLVFLVEQDDADVGPEAVPVKHNQTPIFELSPLCMPGCTRQATGSERRSLPGFRPRPSAPPMKASQILHFHPQGSAGRRRGREPPADDARRHDQEARRRHLHLHADGPARDPQGRGDRARGDEPRRRRRTARCRWCSRPSSGRRPAASRRWAPSCCASRTGTSATSSSSRPAKKWSPTSRARNCAATSSCRRTSTRSRPSSATSAGRASA